MNALVKATKLIEAITKELRGIYKLEKSDRCVKGQAFTYLQKNLREQGWRGMTEYNLETIVQGAPGLGWGRGRGERIFHGGVTKFGVICTVIYRLPEFSVHMVQSAQAKGWNILDVHVVEGDGVQAPGAVVMVYRHYDGPHGYIVYFWNEQDGGFHSGTYCETSEEARAAFDKRRARYGVEARMEDELGGQP